MKKREVILDFTSLLDVTLIIIFFFVLFSHLESEENKAKLSDKMHDYDVAIEDAEAREDEANALIDQLNEDIGILADSDKRRVHNAETVIEYKNGKNLKIMMDIQEDKWTARVVKEDKLLQSIESDSDVPAILSDTLKNAGYEMEDTILCEYVYDGDSYGSHRACVSIEEALQEVRKQYKYFYCSGTDLSIGR